MTTKEHEAWMREMATIHGHLLVSIAINMEPTEVGRNVIREALGNLKKLAGIKNLANQQEPTDERS